MDREEVEHGMAGTVVEYLRNDKWVVVAEVVEEVGVESECWMAVRVAEPFEVLRVEFEAFQELGVESEC